MLSASIDLLSVILIEAAGPITRSHDHAMGSEAARNPAEEVGTRQRNATPQSGRRSPAQRDRPARVHQLARRAVGLAGVELDAAGVPSTSRDQSRQFADRQVLDRSRR